jgi:hypothetical protein
MLSKQRSLAKGVDVVLRIENRMSPDTSSNLPLPPSDLKKLFRTYSKLGLQKICTVGSVILFNTMSEMRYTVERV